MRRALIVACTLAALTAAAPARAAVTIGPPLTEPPTGSLTTTGGVTATSHVSAQVAGVITRWRARVDPGVSPIRLRVLRPSAGVEIGRSDPATVVTATEPIESDTRIPVVVGDEIALECCLVANGAIFASTGNSDVYPLIGDGAAIPTMPIAHNGATMVNADIEPDRDGDGFGDETQDNCGGTFNPDQNDADDDDLGDACDPDADRDGDGFPNGADVCPTTPGTAPNGCPAPPANPPPPRVNTPAIVRFRTPFVNTEVGPSQLIELDVFDDFGTPTVTVFDDDGTVCTLRGAPYTCTWNPTGADVGRATLLASAVDADNRSSLASVRVRVARFKATLTRRVKGRKVTGKLRLPAAVERALGCAGEVTVRRGKVRRTTKLKRNCTYSVRLPPGKGKPRARFGGNQVVAPT